MSPIELKYHWIEAGNQRPRNGTVRSVILHSTDGHKAGDIQALTEHGGRDVSVHWYTCKDGSIYHFVENARCAYHAGTVDAEQHDNDHTIGIEQEHMDGEEEWGEAILQATGLVVAFLRQQYARIPILSHAAVARPVGRKVDPVDFPWDRLTEIVSAYKGQHISAVAI